VLTSVPTKKPQSSRTDTIVVSAEQKGEE